MKTSEKQSVFLPGGYFEAKAIPQTQIADIYTSKGLIADNGLDSFYHFSQEDSFLKEREVSRWEMNWLRTRDGRKSS
ncbi:hypothetical protein QMA02_20945 [Bacillus wiedmannii]|uniref:hypothetical protein n=1 Tax=Bacillus cereus group TaxID=86661 RepID=UPI001CB88DA4|nr:MULTISPECIES: hypothetical protein [Bacillus cereus group]MDI6678291.1 hypothetical protein [Bacillus wiedmannii]